MSAVVAVRSYRIHPLAAPAFDVVAALLPRDGVGRARAVAQSGEHLVFAGFGALGVGGASATPGLVIEEGLTDADIEAAAWDEVKAIWRLLTTPADALRRFGLDIVRTAPADVLSALDLSLDRDPTEALGRLPSPASARTPSTREAVFDRARARYARAGAGG